MQEVYKNQDENHGPFVWALSLDSLYIRTCHLRIRVHTSNHTLKKEETDKGPNRTHTSNLGRNLDADLPCYATSQKSTLPVSNAPLTTRTVRVQSTQSWGMSGFYVRNRTCMVLGSRDLDFSMYVVRFWVLYYTKHPNQKQTKPNWSYIGRSRHPLLAVFWTPPKSLTFNHNRTTM